MGFIYVQTVFFCFFFLVFGYNTTLLCIYITHTRTTIRDWNWRVMLFFNMSMAEISCTTNPKKWVIGSTEQYLSIFHPYENNIEFYILFSIWNITYIWSTCILTINTLSCYVTIEINTCILLRMITVFVVTKKAIFGNDDHVVDRRVDNRGRNYN